MPWDINVDKLREALTQLHEALARPHVASFSRGETLRHDISALSERLTPVVMSIRGRDFDTLRTYAALHGGMSSEQAGRLHRTVEELHRAWYRRLHETLGPAKAAAVRTLLDGPSPELLGMFGKHEDENAHSDVLRWLLDPACAPSTAVATIKAIVARLENADRWASLIDDAVKRRLLAVRREVVLGREGLGHATSLSRIDVLVTGPGFALAIENKVRSMEHDGQTKTYAIWLHDLKAMTAGIFLSPSGMPPDSPDFKAMSYLELVSCLLEGAAAGPLPPAEAQILGSYLKTLHRRILRAELRNIIKTEE